VIAGQIRIDVGQARLLGELHVPVGAPGLVLLLHASGERPGAHRQPLGESLREAGLGVLVLDLLTPGERELDEQVQHLRLHVPLLAERVSSAIEQLAREPALRELRIGLFATGTATAPALVAAARHPQRVRALVCCSGYPDLAGDWLRWVSAHTLLMVGGRDLLALRHHRSAQAQLGRRARLLVVPGTSDLLEEHPAREQLVQATTAWFVTWLGAVDEVACQVEGP
jgi:putative phosphoribosyl transferase